MTVIPRPLIENVLKDTVMERREFLVAAMAALLSPELGREQLQVNA